MTMEIVVVIFFTPSLVNLYYMVWSGKAGIYIIDNMELNSLYRACSRVDKVGFRITKFQPKRNIFQQLREFHAEHEEMLVLDLEELMEETGCHPPCHYTEYSLPQTPIGKPAEKIDKKSMEIPISYRIVHFLSISGQRIGSFDEKEWKMTLVLT